MPQGVVRDDGRLTQAHALKLLLRPLPWPGVFLLPEQRYKKAGSSHPALRADEPVYRVTGDEQGSCSIHPFTAWFHRWGIGGAGRCALEGAIQLLDQPFAGLVSL